MEFSANEDVIELAQSINTAMDIRTKPLCLKIEQLQAKIEQAKTKLGEYFLISPRDRNKSDELVYEAKALLGEDAEGVKK